MEVWAVQILEEPGGKGIDGDIRVVVRCSVEIGDVGDLILGVPNEEGDVSIIQLLDPLGGSGIISSNGENDVHIPLIGDIAIRSFFFIPFFKESDFEPQFIDFLFHVVLLLLPLVFVIHDGTNKTEYDSPGFGVERGDCGKHCQGEGKGERTWSEELLRTFDTWSNGEGTSRRSLHGDVNLWIWAPEMEMETDDRRREGSVDGHNGGRGAGRHVIGEEE
jgi:hypothetical protein